MTPNSDKNDECDKNTNSENSFNNFFTKVPKRKRNENDNTCTSTKSIKLSHPIPLRNSFSLLTEVNENESDHQDVDTRTGSTSETNAEGRNQKGRPPPPIVFPGNADKNHSKALLTYLEKRLKYGFKLKNGRDKTLLYVNSSHEWTRLKNELAEQKTNFFSYTEKGQKNHAFVLKGLVHEEETEDIKETLITKGIPVVGITRMKTQYWPMYMVITKNTITLNKIGLIKSLYNTVIKWEKLNNKRRIIQCHRCQQHMHGTSNCFMPPKCLKCGEGHLTKECPYPRENPPKCANCGQAHLSNSTSCPIYLEKLQSLNKQPHEEKRKNKLNPPPQMDNTNFPTMKTKETLPKENPANTRWPKMNKETGQQKQVDNTSFIELINEIKNLNDMCNIGEMLRALKDLNTLLKDTTDKNDKFLITINFLNTNINNYAI